MNKIMKISLGVLAAILLILTSCEKSEDIIIEKDITEDDGNSVDSSFLFEGEYWPMEIGNYWVYERSTFNPNTGKTTIESKLDSMYIERDTMINGKRNFVFTGNHLLSQDDDPYLFIQRDSLGNLTDARGTVLASQNNSDTLSFQKGTHVEIKIVMEQELDTVTVPAGTFEALSAKSISHVIYGNRTLIDHEMFAKDIGRVYKSYSYASSESKIYLKLLRYRVQ